MRQLAVAIAVCAWLAGCGDSTAAVRVSAPVATHDPGAAANRNAAEREARRLLTLTDAPSGAKALSSAPPKMAGPATAPVVDSLVDAARFWSVPMTFDATRDWFDHHPPRGHLSKEGTTGGGGPGFRSAGLSYWAGKTKAWESSELEVSLLTSNNPQRTYVRVDGVVVWLDPTPVRDTWTGPRTHFTVAHGCPATDRALPDVSNQGTDLDRELLPDASPQRALVCLYGGYNRDPFRLTQRRAVDTKAAAAAAAELRALPLSHVVGGGHSCPAMTGMAVYVAFDYGGGRSVDLVGGTGGCSTLRNGHILIEAALPPSLGGRR